MLGGKKGGVRRGAGDGKCMLQGLFFTYLCLDAFAFNNNCMVIALLGRGFISRCR